MTHIINHYKRPHCVILNLEPSQKANAIDPAHLIQHRQYYRQLSLLGAVVAFGAAMNKTGITVILSVASDNELEQIIANDPSITSGLLVIKQIIPFINDKLMGLTEESTAIMSHYR